MQSQMARIYSKRVLDAAARSEKWTSVAGERASDKFIGLTSELEILHPRKTQYLQIVAYHREPQLAAAGVNSILEGRHWLGDNAMLRTSISYVTNTTRRVPRGTWCEPCP